LPSLATRGWSQKAGVEVFPGAVWETESWESGGDTMTMALECGGESAEAGEGEGEEE